MTTTPPSEAELRQLEAVVVEALAARDDSRLNVLGFGEVSVALGWPIDNPQFVCKRTPPFTPPQFSDYRDLVVEYIAKVEQSGLAVAPTTVAPISRGDQVISYLVQPMLEQGSLGHNVLSASDPDPDHPFLVSLAETLEIVSPGLSVDAQITNFSWVQSKLTLIDVGTPFLWDDTGKLRFDMKPSLRTLPAPTRRLAERELHKLTSRWNDPRRVGIDIVANLYRQGMPEWVDAAIVALNRQLGNGSVTESEARQFYEEDAKIWPLLKKLQALERWWQTSIRRRPYDWFIYSSFD